MAEEFEVPEGYSIDEITLEYLLCQVGLFQTEQMLHHRLAHVDIYSSVGEYGRVAAFNGNKTDDGFLQDLQYQLYTKTDLFSLLSCFPRFFLVTYITLGISLPPFTSHL